MLLSAFIFGLVSSLHCIGMCGPIAMMLPVDQHNPAKKVIQILMYHSGRLMAYATLGLVFGMVGKGLYLAGLQQQMSIIAGILMIVVVLVPEKILARYNFSKPVYRLLSKIKSSLGNQFKKKSYTALFTIGLLNGLLPCGLVYAALFGAIAMQSESLGVVYMVLYGLGTIPMMTTVVYASNWISQPIRNKIGKIIPYVAVCIGMLFILRGLGLGIPYVSPGNMSLFVRGEAHCG